MMSDCAKFNTILIDLRDAIGLDGANGTLLYYNYDQSLVEKAFSLLDMHIQLLLPIASKMLSRIVPVALLTPQKMLTCGSATTNPIILPNYCRIGIPV